MYPMSLRVTRDEVQCMERLTGKRPPSNRKSFQNTMPSASIPICKAICFADGFTVQRVSLLPLNSDTRELIWFAQIDLMQPCPDVDGSLQMLSDLGPRWCHDPFSGVARRNRAINVPIHQNVQQFLLLTGQVRIVPQIFFLGWI